MSRIVISDPHGCYKTLVALVAKLPLGIPITFAGDLIDRGPDSRKIIDFVREGGHDCVVGNHEVMMINDVKFRVKPDGSEQVFVDYYHSAFMGNGGDSTLASYLIEKEEQLESGEIHKIMVHDIPALKRDIEWLKTLPYHILYENEEDAQGQALLVTHSTAAEVWGEHSPESPIFQDNVTWERTPFPKKIPGIFNVYGHTPQQHKATVKEHFACIDTGAYFKTHQRYGRLTALQFPEMIEYVQENVE